MPTVKEFYEKWKNVEEWNDELIMEFSEIVHGPNNLRLLLSPEYSNWLNEMAKKWRDSEYAVVVGGNVESSEKLKELFRKMESDSHKEKSER